MYPCCYFVTRLNKYIDSEFQRKRWVIPIFKRHMEKHVKKSKEQNCSSNLSWNFGATPHLQPLISNVISIKNQVDMILSKIIVYIYIYDLYTKSR